MIRAINIPTRIITIDNKQYIVKKEIDIEKVISENELLKAKHLYGADTLLKSKEHGIYILGLSIDDANIIDENEEADTKLISGSQ